MNHYTTRAAILPEIVHLIAQQYQMTEQQALGAFYHSATGASFADDETGLYGQSPLFIFGLFKEEQEQK